jgi:hypothetical protein
MFRSPGDLGAGRPRLGSGWGKNHHHYLLALAMRAFYLKNILSGPWKGPPVRSRMTMSKWNCGVQARNGTVE